MLLCVCMCVAVMSAAYFDLFCHRVVSQQRLKLVKHPSFDIQQYLYIFCVWVNGDRENTSTTFVYAP